MLEILKNKLSEMDLDFEISEDAQNFTIRLEDKGLLHVSTKTHKLQMLKLSEELQGQGLASLMLEVAKEVGATELVAEKCGEGLSQENLVKFYEKHGFVAYFQDDNLAAMELA
jgi:GNAT superfamily N-acetyltransferase